VANFSKLFQDEMRRIARKATKNELAQLQKENKALRRAISETRKALADVQRAVKAAGRRGGAAATGAPAGAAAGKEEGGNDRTRISSKTIQTLRAKLGLTQAEFAKLVGVTGQSVYQWENKGGRLEFRRGAKERVNAIKGIGAREARRRLEAMNVVKKRGPRSKQA
jgi:hypothetical protein